MENRIDRLRRTASVLSHLGKAGTLVEVDLRSNPLTLGFYSALSSTSSESRAVSLHTNPSPPVSSDGDMDWEADAEAEAVAKTYLLPSLDADADRAARERLDEDTKLRRRVYEMLAAGACPALRVLDGLVLDREMVARRDKVWERLVELGVLKKREEDEVDGEEEREMVAE